MIKLMVDLLIWVCLWKMVQIAGIAGNPTFLILAIVISYYLIVVKNTYTQRKNGD